MAAGILADLVGALATGAVQVVDLAQPLDLATPIISLPPQFGQSAPFRIERISAYDDRGPAWAWSNISLGEHTGTHFDAPVHWITGKDLPDNALDTIPPGRFVAPANVIDCTSACDADADFLLTPEGIAAWEAQHGRIEAGSWVLLRSGWSRRTDQASFLNAVARGGHVSGAAARRDRLRHRDGGHRCRAGIPLRPAVSVPFRHARGEQVRPREPHQSRQAAAQGRDHHHGTAEDRGRHRQPVPGAGVGAAGVTVRSFKQKHEPLPRAA
jgi:kynurenine formamidase